jgi:hypothetical protein
VQPEEEEEEEEVNLHRRLLVLQERLGLPVSERPAQAQQFQWLLSLLL